MQRVLENLFPWAHARQRRVDDHKARNAVAVLRSEGIADHVADVVRNEGGSLDFECIEDTGDVVPLRFLVVTAGRLGGEPNSAQIGNDDGVIARQVFGERHPHVTGLAISVQEDNRTARAADTHIQFRAIRCDLSRAEPLGISEALCPRRPLRSQIVPASKGTTVCVRSASAHVLSKPVK